jgi:hypothetical protein
VNVIVSAGVRVNAGVRLAAEDVAVSVIGEKAVGVGMLVSEAVGGTGV